MVLIHRRVENRASLRVSVKAYAFVVAKLLTPAVTKPVLHGQVWKVSHNAYVIVYRYSPCQILGLLA